MLCTHVLQYQLGGLKISKIQPAQALLPHLQNFKHALPLGSAPWREEVARHWKEAM